MSPTRRDPTLVALRLDARLRSGFGIFVSNALDQAEAILRYAIGPPNLAERKHLARTMHIE
jgi:hypothetical protein